MKSLLVILILGISLSASAAAELSALISPKEKMSYSLGVSFARDFKKMGKDIDYDALIRGIRDESSGSKLLLDEAEQRRQVNAFKFEQRQKSTVLHKGTEAP